SRKRSTTSSSAGDLARPCRSSGQAPLGPAWSWRRSRPTSPGSPAESTSPDPRSLARGLHRSLRARVPSAPPGRAASGPRADGRDTMRLGVLLTLLACVAVLGIAPPAASAAPDAQDYLPVMRAEAAGPALSPALQAAVLAGVTRVFPPEVIQASPLEL